MFGNSEKTEKKTNDKEAKSALDRLAGRMSLETITYSFFGIYLLLAVIFWGAGYWGRTFFVVVSLGLLSLLVVTIVKYILTLSAAANHRSIPMGLLFAKGIFGLSLPFLLMKIVGALMLAVMPAHRGGILCDAMNVIKYIYWQVAWPTTFTYLFWGSILFLVGLLGYYLARKVN